MAVSAALLAITLLACLAVSALAAATCYGFEEQWGACQHTTACPHTCVPRNCAWTQWTNWVDMGGCIGLASREREILQANNDCGTPCSGDKYETKAATTAPSFKATCDRTPTNCKYSDWNLWSKCASPTDQSFSQRSILVHPKENGLPCSGDIMKTRPCGTQNISGVNSNCRFSTWMPWTGCSATCDGGHQTRTRRVAKEAEQFGKGCNGSISETQQCGTAKCQSSQDCTFHDWEDWSQCDSATSHGPYQRYRTRKIKDMAVGSGAPCVGQLKEATGCLASSLKPIDCVFSSWQDWGQCSATCGGGQKFRTRHIQAQAKNGGRCNNTNVQETTGCNIQHCPKPCTYSDWTKWSTCTPLCGDGIQLRERKVTGFDCMGPLKVVRNCTTACTKVDCKWSMWSQWSSCSLKCGGGTQTRSRKVESPPAHGGRQCDPLTTEEIGSCNNHTCGPDCVNGTFTDWSDWSSCSATCQTGFKSRTRQINSVPNFCGFPAMGTTVDLVPCKTKVECVKSQDCKLKQWSDWGLCNEKCFGVRERSRTVESFAQGFYGKPCTNESLKVVEPCNPSVGQKVPSNCQMSPSVDCALNDWGDWSPCSVQCGPGQTTKVRSIKTFPSGGGKPCAGALKMTQSCQDKVCPGPTCVDCKWGDWEPWGHCVGRCNGQRYRHRNIDQLANWCGKNCSLDASMETDKCEGNCTQDVFCAWSDWSSVSSCSPTGCGPQTNSKRRTLKIFTALPTGGSLANGTKYMQCHGEDVFTKACPYVSCNSKPVDCEFHDWTTWSSPTCAQLCFRDRTVKTSNKNGGKPCSGPLKESKTCVKNCQIPVDCVLSSWVAWSHCTSQYTQRFRTRGITTMPKHGGKVCNGALRETTWCTKLAPPVNCKIGDWQAWHTCTRSCAGGTQKRNRAIAIQSAGGGQPCLDSLEELRGCNFANCPSTGSQANCIFGVWIDWTPDVVTGQKSRSRTISSRAKSGGAECSGPLHEVQPLDPVDCKLSDWSAWDACDRTCENGQQERKRQVHQHAMYGGILCPYPLSLSEVRGCTGSGTNGTCPVVSGDAKKTDWSDWSACTATCGPGQQTRSRSLLQNRQVFGKGFDGALKETRKCTDVGPCNATNCVWHDWELWSACSKSCGGGSHQRTRNIKTAPKHGGTPCDPKETEQVQPCNTDPCKVIKCIDGKWGQWSNWGTCSATCLGGIMTRHRTMDTYANTCGQPVNGSDREFKPCQQGVACIHRDCSYTNWDTWSACTLPCDGVSRRTRSIASYGSGNGSFCQGGLEEVETCNPSHTTANCAKYVPRDCVWSDWTVDTCSATCGRGSQTKKRTIKAPAVAGGAPCNGTKEEVLPCQNLPKCSTPAPTDCKWQDWAPWGACSKCTFGQRKRFRMIAKPPMHGGKECLVGDTQQIDGCSDPKLCSKTYCIWADWSKWTACSGTCGNGRRSRKRSLYESAHPAQPAAGNSSSARLFETYQELQRQLEDSHSQRWQELSMAFFGGCTVFFLFAVVVRFVKHARSRKDSSYRIVSRDDDSCMPAEAGIFFNRLEHGPRDLREDIEPLTISQVLE